MIKVMINIRSSYWTVRCRWDWIRYIRSLDNASWTSQCIIVQLLSNLKDRFSIRTHVILLRFRINVLRGDKSSPMSHMLLCLKWIGLTIVKPANGWLFSSIHIQRMQVFIGQNIYTLPERGNKSFNRSLKPLYLDHFEKAHGRKAYLALN